MTSDYKKYSLEQLDNWLFDAINCEDLTSQDIYDTIVRCVNQDIHYHKKCLGKSTKLLSLLKGHLPAHDYLKKYHSTPFSKASEKDWEDFWNSPEANRTWNVSKEQEREYELKEREYERKRAILDAQQNKELEIIRQQGGYEWTPGT
jgi:hypothetical protein